MKKILGIIIALILVAGAGVGVYYVVKESNVSLSISVDNIELCEGEEQVVKYTCNVQDAEILFKIEDESVAQVEKREFDYVVKGLSVGETTLTMTAKYNKYKNLSRAKIVVKEKDSQAGYGEEIDYELHGTSNFEIVGTTITIEAGTPSIFSVVSNDGDIHSVSVACNDQSRVVVTQKTINKIFKIECLDAGTYVLIIRVNGYSKEFTLLVNQQEEGPEDVPEETPEEAGYSLWLQNCVQNEKTITMTHGENAMVQILPGSAEIISCNIVSESSYITISKKSIPANAYTIRCETAGSCTINIIVNEVSTAYTLIIE